ncbi:MAG: hypothetical protein JGK12_15300 [Microcoleus sp. PH2017_01_SCD_O_A]|uniref:hypothetical protein n=1 Tax=unclassified Microcoleus TaxID=2642155 RepID=UPI001D264716|nr:MULTISPECIES: hypothetical protein [unclassified Microcoleus]MCC3431623.1 hypothetical protein [Microcoleus sp. PH2017_04_SCI_O_A]MCC3466487.1 hypothetical protein [Microcoleus sp. PH2017_06_SFM_O_A]TAG68344.1 MAG: hypothetical protein EAZ25_03855 [Oscillatoriales cyanobacterium]MCC3425257.1 hypothetical protein [Microcoleus sp. PH2017_01_SCD_O_A]MCC3497466.1 hypothetical protein [Microcoleus sp. PH2017_15_JOR_U_A]
MKVVKQTPTKLIIQNSSIWDGLVLISPFIIIGLLQIILASNWIGGGIFLLFSLCLLDGAISEIYIFDKTLGKMTVKRRGLSLNHVTERSIRDICAVELAEIEDGEGNYSYYVELLMLGCDRICLRSNSVTEQCQMADLIRSYVSTCDRSHSTEAISLPSKCTRGIVK